MKLTVYPDSPIGDDFYAKKKSGNPICLVAEVPDTHEKSNGEICAALSEEHVRALGIIRETKREIYAMVPASKNLNQVWKNKEKVLQVLQKAGLKNIE